ncbi:DUF6368 family protein [Microbulbifer sp. VTAC004]|uniref:DUF6368 family protein n=1 Tax=unclassified Microbulbifer TaxID=2619833 RepID=UPI00403A1234
MQVLESKKRIAFSSLFSLAGLYAGQSIIGHTVPVFLASAELNERRHNRALYALDSQQVARLCGGRYKKRTMAGPTVGILLKEKLGDDAKREILAFIQSVSSEIRGNDFWVYGGSFGYEFGPDYPEEIEEYAGVSNLLGWLPKDIIGLYAMCNGDRDHQSLGEVTLGIAEIVNGSIAFCHVLSRYTSDPEILEHPGVVEYEHESIISRELFEQWLKHPDFRMVK